MSKLRIILSRIRAFTHARDSDRGPEQEIASHLEEATDEHLRQGLSLEEARREAHVRFGSVDATREEHRGWHRLGRLDGRDTPPFRAALRPVPGRSDRPRRNPHVAHLRRPCGLCGSRVAGDENRPAAGGT